MNADRTDGTPLSCEVCGGSGDAEDVRTPAAGWRQGFFLPELICADCLAVWYGEGETNPDRIREIVRERRAARERGP